MYERYREIIHNDFRGMDQKHVLNVRNQQKENLKYYNF